MIVKIFQTTIITLPNCPDAHQQTFSNSYKERNGFNMGQEKKCPDNKKKRTQATFA